MLKALIVDDELAVRLFLERYLKLLNLEVVSVDNGLNAIEEVKKANFDIIFLDIRMPKINGLQTYMEIKKIRPELSGFFFMTGYAFDNNISEITRESGIPILKKPFEDLESLKVQILDIVNKKNESASQDKSALEKRSFVRMRLDLEVDYRIKGKDENYKKAKVHDISLIGIRLILDQELIPQDTLELIVKKKANTDTYNLVAQVVWSGKSSDSSSFYCGLKFVEINDSFINRFITNII
ncbi:MAG: response regulator [Candidatus Omnitrophica bacterium]|nr:response regulator [Candidatus Omnitrophota bacterium]